MDLQHILKSIKENNIEYMRFEISDQYGISRCKTIPSRHFQQKAIHGHNFGQSGFMSFDPQCGFIQGTGFSHEVNFGDAICYPDYDTYAILPWCENTARVIVNPMVEGKPLPCPREVAKVQCLRLKELGYSLLAAHEYEFIVAHIDTQKPAFGTNQWISTVRSSFNLAFTHQIERDLKVAGVDVESIETEWAEGQLEISYKPAFGLRAADNAYTYRTAIKEIAQKHKYTATFMTKPSVDSLVANGGHLCHSLWDVDGKEGLFYDMNSPNGLSTIANHWMAGILAHAPALTILHAPTINCLNRYRIDSFSPVNVTWGIDNRSCLLRAKPTGPKGTYIENRLGSSGGSPYLSLAGMIIAGLDGIARQLPLMEPITGSAYKESNLAPDIRRIPTNMKDALDEFVQDKVVTDALGERFVKAFVTAKMHEMRMEEEAKAKGDTHWEEKYYSYL